MSKRPNIRWGQSSEDKANIVIYEFNKQISKQQKKNPIDAEVMPDKINVREFKETAKTGTRNDFNREIAAMQKYINDKSIRQVIEIGNGVKTTQWQFDKAKAGTKKINREKKKQMKYTTELIATSRGKETGLKRGEMADMRVAEYMPKQFKPEKISSQKEWKMYVQSVEKQVQDHYTRDKISRAQIQYIQNLTDTFGQYSDIITARLALFTPQQFLKVLKADEQASFLFINDPLDAQARLEAIARAWGADIPEGYFDDFIDSEIYYIGSS